jgi:hypothetical protein
VFSFSFLFFFVQTDGFIFLVKEKQKKGEPSHLIVGTHQRPPLLGPRKETAVVGNSAAAAEKCFPHSVAMSFTK